jgi:hypothetical protein
VREAPGLGYVVWYCHQLEVFGDWFLAVRHGVRRPDNNYYFSPEVQIWINMPGRGSWIDFQSRNRVVLSQWGPRCSTGLSLFGEIPGLGTGISFSSRMEGMNKSYANTLERAVHGLP